MRRRTGWAAVVAVPMLLAACAGGTGETEPTPGATETSAAPEPTTADPTATESATGEPSDPPSQDAPDGTEPDFPASTDEQTADADGKPDLVLMDVRVGEHPGFDRVVLEFAGSGTPGYRVGYVDEVVEQGRGEIIDLDGDASLRIEASGTTYPMEGDEHWDGPRMFEPDGSDVVDEVYVDGTFEGLTVVVAGIDEQVPFRVLTLAEPARLVVDVADADD